MRERRKRLAALALSVAMAMSTLVSPVYAAENEGENATVAEVVEEAPVVENENVQEQSGPADENYSVDESSVVFDDASGTVSYNLVSDANPSNVQPKTVAATKVSASEADCENNATYYWEATVEGGVYLQSGTYEVANSALGHDWDIKDDEGYVELYPNCTEDGKGYYYQVCNRCGKKSDQEIEKVLEAEGHKYGADQVRYEDLNNVEIVDGKLQLIDPLKDGSYTEVTYHVCERYDRRNNTVCGYEDVVKSEEKTLLAEKVSYSEVTDQEGLASTVNLIGMRAEEVPANDKIELADCSKDGRYQVTTYALGTDGAEVPVSQKWVTVPAHHMVTDVTVEFESEEDARMCSYDPATGKVTNNSCWKDITYYEVIHCTAAGCPNEKCDVEKYTCNNQTYTEVSRSDAKVAEHTGDHIINTTAEAAIKAEAAKDYADYAVLKTLADQKESYITLSENTATCTEDGTATVKILCKVCKAEVEEITVKTEKLGHNWGLPETNVIEEATCTSMGTAEAITSCERCGEVKEVRTVKTPRLKHTNETAVTASGIGTDDVEEDATAYIKLKGDKVVDVNGESLALAGQTVDRNWFGEYFNATDKTEFGLIAEVYTNCTVCNNHEVKLADSDTAVFKVVSVEPQDESGKAGSITLQAVYTKADGTQATADITVPYFTSIEAYQGRVEEAPVNGLHQDEDGLYRYYVDGEFQADFSGIVDYAGERFFVANGILCVDGNGLNLYDGEWYFLAYGQIQRQHTGLALYDGEWFYIVNGKLDTTVNGLVPYDGGMFLFADGRLVKEYSGLWQDFVTGKWYFLSLGQVQTQYTGVAMYDGAFFYVRNGELASDYTGTIEYDGATFNVIEGRLYDRIA